MNVFAPVSSISGSTVAQEKVLLNMIGRHIVIIGIADFSGDYPNRNVIARENGSKKCENKRYSNLRSDGC